MKMVLLFGNRLQVLELETLEEKMELLQQVTELKQSIGMI